MKQLDPTNIPQHIAIIMDGNGRWAKQKGKMRIFGHKNAINAVRSSVAAALKMGVKHLTLYAFSQENWNRPETEVSSLMNLFMQALDLEVGKLHKNNICLKILGDVSKFSDSLQQKISNAEKLTQNNTALTLNIAANYSGCWDIVQAAQQLAYRVEQGQLNPAQIDHQLLQQTLATKQQPPVDLLIRTSGELRISNFLLWQIAYAELYFTDVLWPDFDESIFEQAVIDYQQRHRRFGGCE